MSLVFACLGIMAVAAFAVLLVLTLTSPSSPLCIRRRAAAEVAAVPAPEPRAPRDTSRPYPRAKGSRSKLNRVCPACGTGRETGDLDRRVLGWPAHRTCAEWLGDWRPPGYVPPPSYRTTGSITAVAVSNSPGVQVNVGSGGPYRHKIPRRPIRDDSAGFSSEQVAVSELLANGHIAVNEARERLDRRIAASFGVPATRIFAQTGACTEQRLKPAGMPTMAVRCTCGHQFAGTDAWVVQTLDAHWQADCPAPNGWTELP